MVTAETAMVLPLLAAFTLAMAFLVSLGVDQVRIVDAARDAARAVAADGDDDAARQQAQSTSPGVARVEIAHEAGLVDVTVTSTVSPPHWLLVPLPSVTLAAHASVREEAGGA
jgi:hypothetical protein